MNNKSYAQNHRGPIDHIDPAASTAHQVEYTDIALIGAGPVGLALAILLLRDSQWRITIIDTRSAIKPTCSQKNKSASELREKSAQTKRMLALAAGSRLLLEELGAWPTTSTAISTIHVSQRHQFGRTLIRDSDYHLPALGHVIAYEDLLATLSQVLHLAHQQQPNRLSFWQNSQVMQIKSRPESDGYTQLEVQGESKALLQAKLVIHAEGELFYQADTSLNQNPAANNAEPSNRPHHYRDYQQSALLGTVMCSAARPNWAWERFTDEGPLALLPIHTQAQNIQAFSLVWVGSAENCARRMTLNDDAFLKELNSVFGQRMGSFVRISERHVQPLFLRATNTVVQGRRVAIGNAAQTLHPVAGQGLNLGLRDAWSLAHALQDNLSDSTLTAYAQQRREDRQRMIALTDLLPRIFCMPLAPLKKALGLGLLALDLVPPARHRLARQMMFGSRQ